jgi:hypothetical protein
MPYATWSDVEVRLGRALTEVEQRQVSAWLDDVESTIKSRIPTLDDLVAGGSLLAATVRKVEAAAVIRVLRNPDGKLTERIDDYSWTRNASTSSGALSLTDDEWAELTPSSSSDAFSISPAYEPGVRHWVRWDSCVEQW